MRPHDMVASQASDIYSLGLVFLELAIATTETPESATTRRQRARDNADGHKDALRTVLVSGCFSKDVVETLTSMLVFDAVQRVSATDLLSDPYVIFELPFFLNFVFLDMCKVCQSLTFAAHTYVTAHTVCNVNSYFHTLNVHL